MSICDLTAAYPILEKAANKVRAGAPDLARNLEEFKDFVDAFEKSGAKSDLDALENQVVLILDKAEGHFDTDSVDAAVFITIEVQRAAKAKFASDGVRCKAHIDNVVGLKILP